MPHKGRKSTGGAKAPKEQGDKKTAADKKPADLKGPATTEKKHESTSASTSASEPAGAVAAGSSKVPSSQEKTMKPADTKAKPTPKAEPPKSTQATKPKSTTTTSTAKPSTGKGPTKQDAKLATGKQKPDTATSSGAAAGKAAAGKAAATSVLATSKPKEEIKEEKKTVNVEKIAAVSAPVKNEKDTALDELIDSLGGPDDVPESPKFTGPEIADTPATSEYLEELGKRESTIPPEYRHLLDGKGDKPMPPPPKKPEESLGDDDLIAAMSSEFVSCQAPPEEKKPKLEEKKEARSTSTAPTAPTQPSSVALPEEALDELLDSLGEPPAPVPESPQYTGPEVTEAITSTYLEELGKREHTIPPEYRHLLDGKDHGKPIPPAADEPPSMSDSDLLDEFSKDFVSLSCPAVQTTPALQPKDSARDKEAKPDVVIPSLSSSVQAAAAPSAGMEDALDELMGTLEGPEFNVPESPVYTGPEVTETSTATHIEELGKRESSIPPEYRHLLDGKEGGKAAPSPPAEKPMSDSEMLDEFDKDFAWTQPTPPVKPKDAPEVKKPEPDVVVSASSSAVQAAPAPSKAPAKKADPLDALAGTLGVRQEDPKDKKPAADKVKEKTGKENREKQGKDEETIPPEYRLQEVKDKDGKPLLPKPEKKPQPMSEDDLLDALTEGFDTSPATSQCAPLQSSAKAPGKSVSEETVSCSKVSGVQAAAPKPADSKAPGKSVSEETVSCSKVSGVQAAAPKPADSKAPGKSVSEETVSCSKVSGVQAAAPKPADSKAPGKSVSEETVSCSKVSGVQAAAPKPADSIPDDALDLLSGSLGTRQVDPDENKPVVDMVKEKAKKEHIDRLGDRDDTIPPEYRHLLDGKDQGKPAKPEAVKPKKPLEEDAAIGALSSDFASCDTSSTDKAHNSSKDKTKSSTSAPVSQTAAKVPESSKSTGQCSSVKPSAQKTSKS